MPVTKSIYVIAQILILLLATKTNVVVAQESIVVYNRNLDNPFIKESIENLTQLSANSHGAYIINASTDMEHGEAFEALANGKIDIMVTSPTAQREAKAKIVYLPLDRGLLGFRVCLTNTDSRNLNRVRTQRQFIRNKFSVGLGRSWPDYDIYKDSGFDIVASSQYEMLFKMLDQQKFDCLSRSIVEVGQELDKFKNYGFAVDSNIMFIYPQADFIFVNPHKPELLKRFNTGYSMAVENNSYYEIFDKHFAKKMKDHRVFERHMIFIKNKAISPEALASINRYAIASFINHQQ
jgi:ABC-type amino acid transport substrate-binding protein